MMLRGLSTVMAGALAPCVIRSDARMAESGADLPLSDDLFLPMARKATRPQLNFASLSTNEALERLIAWQDGIVTERLLEAAKKAVGGKGANSSVTTRQKFLGAILGCAVGDALGATNEYLPWGTFDFVAESLGSTAHPSRPGDWTDDTSHLLCLLDSLVANGMLSPEDFKKRLQHWLQHGSNTAYGKAFGVGRQTMLSLRGPPQPVDEKSVGNGSLMRLAPAALLKWRDLDATRKLCAASSVVTHPAREAQQLCSLFGVMIAQAVAADPTGEKAVVWTVDPSKYTDPQTLRIAHGCWVDDPVPCYKNNGYAFNALRVALWCFKNTSTFNECVYVAANLGDDADTTAAIAGQLAGAFYGVDSIKKSWLASLAHADAIKRAAENLYGLAEKGKAAAIPNYVTIPAGPARSAVEMQELEEKIVAQVRDNRPKNRYPWNKDDLSRAIATLK